MIIIGDEYIPYENISSIKCIEDISNTAANSTVIFDFDKDIMLYCMQNDINYGVMVSSLQEAVVANAMDSKYIIPRDNILQTVQNIAENYMFDSKIIALIESQDDIEEIALKSIDGVIYKQVIL